MQARYSRRMLAAAGPAAEHCSTFLAASNAPHPACPCSVTAMLKRQAWRVTAANCHGLSLERLASTGIFLQARQLPAGVGVGSAQVQSCYRESSKTTVKP